MYYDINYKRKTDPIIKHWKYINKDQLDLAIRQLKYMATTFNGDVVLWIEDLEFLQIEERNYAYKEYDEYFIKNKNNNDFTSMSELILYWYDELLPDSFYEKDITNTILRQFNIIWNNYHKKWKVILKNNILFVDWIDFKLEEWKKAYELFDLIFRARDFYKKLSFSYDELKFVYKNWGVKYKELEPYINKEYIDNTLWKKIREIKKRTSMENKIIENNNWILSIRQETAPLDITDGQDIFK